MPKTCIVPICELKEEPYASVVCYPHVSIGEIQERIKELQKLGVDFIDFNGKASAFTLHVLGKGYVGIVVAAMKGNERYALKMQRVDSDRESLEREAELLAKANSVNVGPRLVAVTKRFLLMQLIDGSSIEDWLDFQKEKTDVQAVLADILEQCWRLDQICLDHGELSKAPKHLLLDKSNKPFMVDFETASTARNASNVTSVCQFLFQGNSNACKAIAKILGERCRPKMIDALRKYRKERSRENFEDLKQLCFSEN
jgi:putative serine/threonine protein kinase